MHFRLMTRNISCLFFFQIVGLIALLFSCTNNSSNAHDDYKNTLTFQEDSVSYTFESRSSIYGLGTPFDFCYYYDAEKDKEYVYQIYINPNKTAEVVKNELSGETNTVRVRDTFKLSNLSVGPLVSSLYLSVTALDSLVIIKKSRTDKDSVYSYYQASLIDRQKLKTQNNGHQFVTDYNVRYNKIVSSNLVTGIYPIYTRKMEKEAFLKLPQFMNTTQQQNTSGLWSISEHYPQLTDQQFSFLQAQFSIHLKDKVCHLDPGSTSIDVYTPANDAHNSIAISGVAFENPIAKNNSAYTTVIEVEADYWYDFMYNPYLEVYILIQHVGTPYFDADGNLFERKDGDLWAKVVVLDSDFKFINLKELTYKDESPAIINPKFPTKDGYVYIDIVGSTADTLGVIYTVEMKKKILGEL